MKPLASILVSCSAVMLVVHAMSWKLVEKWYGGDSWVKRRLTPLRVLRGEAVYWVTVMAAWPLWRSAVAKITFSIFAAVHLGGWVAAELRPERLTTDPEPPYPRRTITRAVTVFDLAEVFPLVAVAAYGLSCILGAK
jgi:hypothetical protein